MENRCLRCKGRGFCGKYSCAIQAKMQIKQRIEPNLPDRSFQSASPAPFVGRAGYPRVNLGILAPVADDGREYDSPRRWVDDSLQIPDIMDIRSSLINSRKKALVFQSDRFILLAQEIAMAQRPVAIDLEIERRPVFSLNMDDASAPTGPLAELKTATLSENPKVNPHIEKAFQDTDLKASDAVKELYSHGIDENHISKIFSVGTLGKKRKIVPTRWSITAVDDQLGLQLIEEIKDMPESDYLAFFGSHLGNYYLIMLFPDIWRYELFEIYLPKASWNQSESINYCTDYEGYKGRKEYASECAGGYYAARLPILEKLKSMKRQASVLAFRMITGEYTAPLGVWVCREAARDSLKRIAIDFSGRELMLDYAKGLLMKKFNYNIEEILKKSQLLKEITQQKKLFQF